MSRVWVGRGVACGVAMLFLCGARLASAQELALTFRDGRVSLVARDVTVRQILDDWARLGQTIVVNAELLGNERVTLRLDDVPERQAIDEVLRSAAGYLAIRRETGATGPSIFARILVLATSDVPAAAPAARAMDADGGPASLPSALEADVTPAMPSPDPAAEDPPNDTLEEAKGVPAFIASAGGATPDPARAANLSNGRAPDERPTAPSTPPTRAAKLAESKAQDLPSGRQPDARPSPPGAIPAIVPVVVPAEVAEPATTGGSTTLEAPTSDRTEDGDGRKTTK